jgi:dihydroorotate dehydrogenase
MPKRELVFSRPILNAAGTLGWAPRRSPELEQLGAFVTNPISPAPRQPAAGPRCLHFPGGILLHSGHPNPGFRAALRRYRPAWARSALPVIVHLLFSDPAEAARMVARLENMEEIAGVELGIHPLMTPAEVSALLVGASGELPLIARLPLDRAVELAPSAAQASAISLGPARGSLPLPGGGLLHGRLYGPSLLPLALQVVQALSQAGCQVIAAGGISSQDDVDAMLSTGAFAVQLDTILWRGGLLPPA